MVDLKFLGRLWPRRPAFSSLDFVLGSEQLQFEQSGLLPERGTVAFLVSCMTKGSGGHTSVLRLGTWLSRFGYDVSYITLPGQSAAAFASIANFNLPDWRGTPIGWAKFVSSGRSFDLGVATLWTSCYYLASHQSRFGRKGYFIQDYEPYFYPVGDQYFLAENTYRMGLEHRSLGPWNLLRVAGHTGIGGGVALPFPVELREYPMVQRKLQHGRRLRVAAYLRPEARRAGTLISLGLEYAKRQLQARGMDLDVRVFGMPHKARTLRIGTNLGKLNRAQLRDLYAWADFGIVGSLTNISLINYEMIACGLPVIDFEMGSAPTFFGLHEMLFAGTAPESLYSILGSWTGRERELESMVMAGQAKIRDNDWSWERVATEFRQSFV